LKKIEKRGREMKIYKAEMDLSIVPEIAREVLKRLGQERNLAIKGGLARLVLLHNMINVGKYIDRKRMEIEDKIHDIDIIVLHSQPLAKSRDYLLEKETALKEMLSSVISEKEIRFDGRDIEPVRGSFKDECKKTKTLAKILRSRDLTFNEVVLVPENEKWIAYYTPRCWRDLINGIGMLTSGGWKTIRYDAGRMVPSNYGFFRLLRFWVEGRVTKIWLPSWMIKVHLEEMNRLQKKGLLPEGANLGRYGRIIAEEYRDAEPQLRQRWIRALNYLGFTDLPSFELFAKEQELLDTFKYQEFSFKEEVSLSEVIDKMLEERRQKEKDRRERKSKMMSCEHKFIEINCNGCPQRCKIKKCVFCNYVENDKEFLCNLIFQTGDWKRDVSSLIAFPSWRQIKSNTTLQITS